MNATARRRTAALTFAAALALTGCTAEMDPTAPPEDDTATQETPEPPTQDDEGTDDAADAEDTEDTEETADQATHNDADVELAEELIRHHEAAVAMADLATDRVESGEVADLAERITLAHSGEVDQLRGMLQQWGEGVPGTGDTEGVEGEDSEYQEQVDELEGLEGAEFDDRFLEIMIDHHRSGIELAEQVQQAGSDPDMQDLAEQMIQEMQDEIEIMERLREQDGVLDPADS
jgi:uncharacterized protein (DUF305 family)